MAFKVTCSVNISPNTAFVLLHSISNWTLLSFNSAIVTEKKIESRRQILFINLRQQFNFSAPVNR